MSLKLEPPIQASCQSFTRAFCVAAILLLALKGQAQNLFVGAATGNSIVEFAPDGTATTFASGLSDARALAFNSSGALFEADVVSGNIYEFAPSGTRTTFASGLHFPDALAINDVGDLFVGSGANIYEFTPNGVQTTFASSPGGEVLALAFDNAGNLFVGGLDLTGAVGGIVEITPDGVQKTFVSGLQSAGLAFNAAGDLFVADHLGALGTPNPILEIAPDGTESTFASGLLPVGLAFNSAGNLFEADSSSGNIYEFTPNGSQTTFASGLGVPVALAFQPVPEPSSFGLLVVALLTTFFTCHRQKVVAQSCSLFSHVAGKRLQSVAAPSFAPPASGNLLCGPVQLVAIRSQLDNLDRREPLRRIRCWVP